MKRMPIGYIIIHMFLVLLVCIPIAMSGDRVYLRSQAKQLSDHDLKAMLTKYSFFDRTKNRSGAFVNDFVDNGDGTVTDRITGLMWQKDGSSEGMTWVNANKYVKKLNDDRFAGYADWRLPTIEELASLMSPKRSNKKLYIDPIFSEEREFCWSADTFGSDTAWYTNFKTGIIQHIYVFYYHVRAVRTLK